MIEIYKNDVGTLRKKQNNEKGQEKNIGAFGGK